MIAVEIEEGGKGGGRSEVMLARPHHFSSRPFEGSQRPVPKAVNSHKASRRKQENTFMAWR